MSLLRRGVAGPFNRTPASGPYDARNQGMFWAKGLRGFRRWSSTGPTQENHPSFHQSQQLRSRVITSVKSSLKRTNSLWCDSELRCTTVNHPQHPRSWTSQAFDVQFPAHNNTILPRAPRWNCKFPRAGWQTWCQILNTWIFTVARAFPGDCNWRPFCIPKTCLATYGYLLVSLIVDPHHFHSLGGHSCLLHSELRVASWKRFKASPRPKNCQFGNALSKSANDYKRAA